MRCRAVFLFVSSVYYYYIIIITTEEGARGWEGEGSGGEGALGHGSVRGVVRSWELVRGQAPKKALCVSCYYCYGASGGASKAWNREGDTHALIELDA